MAGEAFLSADFQRAIVRAERDPELRREVIGGLTDMLHTCEERLAFSQTLTAPEDAEVWKRRKAEVLEGLARLKALQ